MDIEERAEKWADKYIGDPQYPGKTIRESLIDAYMAGVNQVRSDYEDYRGR